MSRQRIRAEVAESVTFRAVSDDWADLEAIYGTGRAEIVRQLIAAHLRRPGAEPPAPPSLAAIARARKARTSPPAQDTAAAS
jgi:hypothetical protein